MSMNPTALKDGLLKRFGWLIRWIADPLSLVLTAFYLVILVRNAWISEDAYITMRTVDNFIQGYGLRWNTIERVQSYTHPLWMFALSFFYWFTREVYYTVILLCLAVSAYTVWLVCARVARTGVQAVLCAVILTLSKAYMDYSTSGLENPLTHLLLAFFCLLYLCPPSGNTVQNQPSEVNPSSDVSGAFRKRRLFWLSAIAALGAVNRMDTILLYLPALLHLFVYVMRGTCNAGRRLRMLGVILAGFTPFIVWECFSLFYYGFLFPNTAYAKLNTGIHSYLLVAQGFNFLINSLTLDPLTLMVIVGTILYSLIRVKWNPRETMMALGVVAYLVYIVRIGGDYMSGRLLSAPILVSAVIQAQTSFKPRHHTLPVLGVALILGLANPINPVQSGPGDVCKAIANNGISDERRYYNADLSLLCGKHPHENYFALKGMAARAQREKVMVDGTLGMLGYYAGPDVHIIDPLGLTDPLLARLPTIYYQWRIGHFIRELPPGYQECVMQGNTIQDPSLARYWDALVCVTRGELWSRHRFQEIWKFMTGHYDRYIDEYCQRSYLIIRHIDPIIYNPGSEESGDTFILYLNAYGIGLYFPPGSIQSRNFSVTLSPGKSYSLHYYRQGQIIARQTIQATDSNSDELVLITGTLSEHAIQLGFDMLRILPGGRWGAYKVGTFRITTNDTITILHHPSTAEKKK